MQDVLLEIPGAKPIIPWSSSVEEQLVLGFAGPPTVSFSCFRSGETAQFKLGASSPPTI